MNIEARSKYTVKLSKYILNVPWCKSRISVNRNKSWGYNWVQLKDLDEMVCCIYHLLLKLSTQDENYTKKQWINEKLHVGI